MARLASRHSARWMSLVLGWKDAWRRQTVRFLHAGSSGPANRLGRGRRRLGTRRWDNAIQATISEAHRRSLAMRRPGSRGMALLGTGLHLDGDLDGTRMHGPRAPTTPHARRDWCGAAHEVDMNSAGCPLRREKNILCKNWLLKGRTSRTLPSRHTANRHTRGKQTCKCRSGVRCAHANRCRWTDCSTDREMWMA